MIVRATFLLPVFLSDSVCSVGKSSWGGKKTNACSTEGHSGLMSINYLSSLDTDWSWTISAAKEADYGWSDGDWSAASPGLSDHRQPGVLCHLLRG